MIKIACQLKDKCPKCESYIGPHFMPLSLQDADKVKAYKINQILTSQFSGTEKERSLSQLKLYWDRATYVAQQLSDQNELLSRYDIDFEVKIAVAKSHPALIKRFKSVGGIVYMEPISISFLNMDHLTACDFFKHAFKVMADMIGGTVEDLLEMPDENY